MCPTVLALIHRQPLDGGREPCDAINAFRVVSRSQYQHFLRSSRFMQGVRFPAAPPRRPRSQKRSRAWPCCFNSYVNNQGSDHRSWRRCAPAAAGRNHVQRQTSDGSVVGDGVLLVKEEPPGDVPATGAGDRADQYPIWLQPVAAGGSAAVVGPSSRHGGADQIADRGHGLYFKGVDSLVSGVDRRT